MDKAPVSLCPFPNGCDLHASCSACRTIRDAQQESDWKNYYQAEIDRLLELATKAEERHNELKRRVLELFEGSLLMHVPEAGRGRQYCIDQLEADELARQLREEAK